MSRSRPKRRKVWVNFYAGAGPLPDTWGTHLGTKATVLRAAQEGAEQVHLVESRPGDVVLSREEAKDITELVAALAREAQPGSLAATWVPSKVQHALRGRR